MESDDGKGGVGGMGGVRGVDASGGVRGNRSQSFTKKMAEDWSGSAREAGRKLSGEWNSLARPKVASLKSAENGINVGGGVGTVLQPGGGGTDHGKDGGGEVSVPH